MMSATDDVVADPLVGQAFYFEAVQGDARSRYVVVAADEAAARAQLDEALEAPYELRAIGIRELISTGFSVALLSPVV